MLIRRAASKWQVNEMAVGRLKKNPEHSFHRPTIILTKEEEKMLATWVQQCCDRAAPRGRRDILDMAFKLLKRRQGEAAKRPSYDWLKLFMTRNNLKSRKAQLLTSAACNVKPQDLKNWFSAVYEELDRQGHSYLLSTPDRIFNGDESMFLFEVVDGEVIVKADTKNVTKKVTCEKTGLTVMLTIRADGKKYKPLIVYPGKRIPTTDNFPSDRANRAVTGNGWMDTNTFCFWLECLAQQANEDGLNLPVEKILVFVDNHASHVTLESLKTADELGIVLIPLYPNCTFILQPADVACFSCLKSYWKEEVRQLMFRNFEARVTKVNFAEIYLRAEDKLSEETIKNGFRKCGLFPFDALAVDYSRLKARDVETNRLEEDHDIENTEDLTSTPEESFDPDRLLTEENFEKVLDNSLPTIIQKAMLKEFIKRHREHMLYTATAQPVEFSFQDFSDNSYSSFDMVLIPEIVMSASDEQSTSTSATASPNFVLPLPQTPKRKGNRVTERTPVIATSKENLARLEAKKAAKEQLEEEKRQRENLRLSKKRQKVMQDLAKLDQATKKQRLKDLTQDINSASDQIDLTCLFPDQRVPFQQLQNTSNSLKTVQLDKPTQLPKKTAPRRKKVVLNKKNSTLPENVLPTIAQTDPPVKRSRGRPRKNPITV